MGWVSPIPSRYPHVVPTAETTGSLSLLRALTPLFVPSFSLFPSPCSLAFPLFSRSSVHVSHFPDIPFSSDDAGTGTTVDATRSGPRHRTGVLTPRHRVQRTWSRAVAGRRPRWAVLPGDGGNVGPCRLETAETMEVRSPSRPLSPLPQDRPGRNSGNAGVASRSSLPVGLSRGRPFARCRHGRTRRRRPTRTKQPVPDEPARFGENHSPGQNHQIRTKRDSYPSS